jgi:diazepam-binding inhibitor (GABA receptor modulating acyl-CoA-binding protein)
VDIQKDFKAAQDTVKKLKARPSNDELLQLYALYKQAESGDASGSRPGMFNLKERAKWDAWNEKKGLKNDKAMQDYSALVAKLVKAYGV